MAEHVDRDPHAVDDLLDSGVGQAGLSHLLEDALDARSPLLHDPGFAEDARQRGVAQSGHPPHGVDGHAGEE